MTTYLLPEELRAVLKRPLGELVSGENIDLGTLLRELILIEKPAKVILVGDNVSRRASQAGLRPDVIIIDNVEKRQSAEPYAYTDKRIISVRNRAGMLEEESLSAVEQAIRGQADLVNVDGEEDLLAIAAVLAAPLRSLVVYGQPNEGVVLVRVSGTSKTNAAKILSKMRRVEQS